MAEPKATAKATETAKTNENAKATAPKKNKHLVTFLGAGVYADRKGRLWSQNEDKKKNVLKSREFATVKDQAAFLKDNADIEFMVTYKSMSIVTLGEDNEDTVEED